MKKQLILALSWIVFLSPIARADEGMWLPQLLQQLNAPEMRLKGLQIPVEEIYSANKNSLKDAVVLFGGGCTGEIISGQGLLLTNHHCGFGQIQEHSSLEHNYLRDGFWAKELTDEIPCPGLTATFIIRMDDVSSEFTGLDALDENARNERIKAISTALEKKASEGNRYEAKVRQFYAGNTFILIVTETFRDVRLVGAPPSSIGKFGGDTDNWMWPRHTGDFSLFRVYASADNAPAAYSPSNRPFKPRHFFPISLAGVQPEDFTLVYGFPGRTQQYVSSFQLKTTLEVNNPNRIAVRTRRLEIMDKGMRSSEKVHIQYAAKQSSVSNAWKKWKGESKGLNGAKAVQRKRVQEVEFQGWVLKDTARQRRYGSLITDYAELYTRNTPYLHANDFYAEAVMGVEVLSFASALRPLMDAYASTPGDTAILGKEWRSARAMASDHFKDYHRPLDLEMTAALLSIFDQSVPDSLKPAEFLSLRARHNADFSALANQLFASTFLVDSAKTLKCLNASPKTAIGKLHNDPAYQLASALMGFHKARIAPAMNAFNARLARLNRIYMAGQLEMQPEKKFYPDANGTLRVAYGQVRGYDAADAVRYGYQTTLDGVMEKYKAGDEEFDLPARLIDLHRSRDFGRYAVNGTIPVSFIATNHTTGGNSGSPVLNAKGQLIGTNYDRVWEGTMSDLLFNPEICRNITLDIRYTLFIIDKFAGARRLVDEMDILP
ncbi:MAG: S46 family peptidase [Bacteroidota bacterium]|jgi:hypothetical protein